MLTAEVEIHETRPDRIHVMASYHVKESIKAVPGARWDTKEKIWTVPLAWPACLALRAEFTDGLILGPKLKEWARLEAERKKTLIDMRPLLTDEGADPLPELRGFESLFGHQRVDARAIAHSRRYLLLNETGTGKSRSALAGLSLIEHSGNQIFPLLIVAPKSMLRTWEREIEGFFEELDVRVCQGTPATVRDRIVPGGDVYIIGWDSVRRYSRLAPYGNTAIKDEDKIDKELQKIKFTSAVVDEIHRGKNGESMRTRAVWAATASCENVVGLTGTPVQDTPEDLWAVLRLLFPAEYPTKTSYVNRFLQTDWGLWGGREITGLKDATRDEFFKNFDAVSRRITKDMSLKLPPKMYTTRWVELPPKLRKAYDSMQKSLVAELESSTVAAGNVLERAQRLIQLANAWGDVREDGMFVMQMPSPKIEAFMEDLKDGDFDGQQVVIFSDSRQLADLLEIEMRKAKTKPTFVMITGAVTGDDRQKAIDTFQAGDAQFCIVTRAGGEGVTLTAASTMVRLVRSWSYTTHTQAEDRVHRIGSERHDQITYIDYVTDDTVEVAQLVKLNAKEERAQEILRDKDLLEMIKEVESMRLEKKVGGSKMKEPSSE